MSDTPYEHHEGPPLRRVGNYDLLEEIGAGGMSRVYRGRRVGSQEVVAVKVMLIENTAPDYQARLHREPEIQHGIGHENIVHLIESFSERDEFFLVMEYIDGQSLAGLIRRGAGLPFARARLYVRQILRALDHLHRLGIVHRDIKPSNILIDHNDVAKLADFGIAKYTWQQAQTSTQRGLGTPEYMSPEQARGEHVDHRSDIYSLGITLYEALAGRRPFAREHATPAAYGEVIQEILTRPLPDPRTYNRSLTPETVRLLTKATAKNPNDRFQTCAEFLGALDIVGYDDGAIDSQSASAGAAYPDRREELSAPTVVGTGAERAQSASTVAGVGTPPPPPAGGPPTGGAARPKPVTLDEPRRNPWPWIALAAIVLGVGGYFGYQWWQNTYGRAHLTDADALRVSKNVAADVKRFTLDNNPSALATVYDSTGVDFFKRQDVTRRAVFDEIAKFTNRIVRNERYDVEVKRARAVNDTTIETEWEITYQRMRNDSTLLRGATSNIVRLHNVDGQWLIASQKEKWTKRDNVAPVKPPPDSTRAADSMSVVDIKPQHSVDNDTKVATFRMFLTMLAGGDAAQAWESYAATPLKTSADRSRFSAEVAAKGYDVVDVTIEGDAVSARLTRTEADGTQGTLRVHGTVVDEGGSPKVASIKFSGG